MPVLELHKIADKSGTAPAEGEPWPLRHVELHSALPPTHVFSDQYVHQAIAEGWMEFTGKPLKYKVHPDPGGEFRFASPQTLSLPGDQIVLHLVREGEEIDVVYRITEGPVPRGFRIEDDDEPTGFRSTHEYRVALEG